MRFKFKMIFISFVLFQFIFLINLHIWSIYQFLHFLFQFKFNVLWSPPWIRPKIIQEEILTFSKHMIFLPVCYVVRSLDILCLFRLSIKQIVIFVLYLLVCNFTHTWVLDDEHNSNGPDYVVFRYTFIIISI